MPTYADLVSRLGKLDVALQESPSQPDLAVYNLFQVASLKAWYQDSVDVLATSDQRSLNVLVDQLAQSVRKLRCACDLEALAKAFEEAPQDIQAKLTKLNNAMQGRLRVVNDLVTDLVASTHEVDADAKKHAQMIVETENKLASEIGGLSSRIARVSFENLTHDTRSVEDLLNKGSSPTRYARLDAATLKRPNLRQERSGQQRLMQGEAFRQTNNQALSTQNKATREQVNQKVSQEANMLQTLHAKLLRVYSKLSRLRDDLAKAQVEGNTVLARRLEANIKQLKSNALALGGACQLAASANRKRVLVKMYTSSRGDYKRTKNVVNHLEKSIRHAKQPDLLAQWHYVQDRVHEQANGLRVFLMLEAKNEVDEVRRQAVKSMHRNAVMLFDVAEQAILPLDLTIAELTKYDSEQSVDDNSSSAKPSKYQVYKACAQILARKYSNDMARILHKLTILFPKSTPSKDEQQEPQNNLSEKVETLIVTNTPPKEEELEQTKEQDKQHEEEKIDNKKKSNKKPKKENDEEEEQEEEQNEKQKEKQKEKKKEDDDEEEEEEEEEDDDDDEEEDDENDKE